MILRLVREQLRTQWRYTAWSAGLLAFALALATYAMVTGSTNVAFQHDNDEFTFGQGHHAIFQSVIGDGVDNPVFEGLEHPIAFSEVQSLLAAGSSTGLVDASMQDLATIEGYPGLLFIAAPATPVRWDRYLATGSAPKHGEVALNLAVARTLDLKVGDTVTLDAVTSRAPGAKMTFVISGMVRTNSWDPYWTTLPDVIAPWGDAQEIALGLPTWAFVDPKTSGITTVLQTNVAWDGSNSALDPYDDPTLFGSPSGGFLALGTAWSGTNQIGYWSLTAACLAVVGMMIAAFGMGRAQAEARTRWAATARVLGATRRTIALSSLIEATIVSLAGVALGLAAGVAAVAANIAVLRARHPEALLPSGPSVPATLILAGVAIGSAIAIVVAAAPAFWTARVAPVAALKPVTPIGEATVSREVSPWWPVWILGGSCLALAALYWLWERGERSGTDVTIVLMWVSCLAVFVSAAALALEGSRRLVGVVGAALARSHRPSLIAAGDGLRAHGHVFTFASLSSLALTAAFAWNATDGAIRATNPSLDFGASGEPPLPSFSSWWLDQLQASGRAAGFGIIIGVATVVAVAVTLASRSAFAADAATRSALGLTGAGERVAAAARQWAVMGSAAIVGGLLGWAVRLAVRLAGAALSPRELAYSIHWNLTVAAYGLAGTALVMGVALGITLAGSLVVGLFTRPGTPVQTLRRASR